VSQPPPAIGEVLISEEQLQGRVSEIAAQVSEDYAGRDLLVIGVLKGAVFFIADLVRQLQVPCELDFMAVSSHGSSTHSSGVVRIQKDLDVPIAGRDVLLVEDVIDSGLTLSYLLKNLTSRAPASLEICTLLAKPGHKRLGIASRYVGFELPDVFVIGYGLDYAQRYRNLPYIAVLNE
jgi:hypoxanthine phosphoribosyltransferase